MKATRIVAALGILALAAGVWVACNADGPGVPASPSTAASLAGSESVGGNPSGGSGFKLPRNLDPANMTNEEILDRVRSMGFPVHLVGDLDMLAEKIREVAANPEKYDIDMDRARAQKERLGAFLRERLAADPSISNDPSRIASLKEEWQEVKERGH